MTCIQVMGQSPEAGTEPALQPTGRRWVLSGAAGQSTARQQGPEVSHRALKPRGEPGRTSEQPVRSREGSGAVGVPGAVGMSQSSRSSGVLQSSRSLEQHVVMPSGAVGLSQSSRSSGVVGGSGYASSPAGAREGRGGAVGDWGLSRFGVGGAGRGVSGGVGVVGLDERGWSQGSSDVDSV